MSVRWIGAVCIVAACGGFGFSLASDYRKREGNLQQLWKAVELMKAELRYQLTPLPEILMHSAQWLRNPWREFLNTLALDLERRESPDVISCMRRILSQKKWNHIKHRMLLLELGRSLGRYDLEGQLRGLDQIHTRIETQLQELRTTKKERIRSYQTLSICAGIALVILFC